MTNVLLLFVRKLLGSGQVFRELSWGSCDYATRWTIQGSSPQKDKRGFSYSRCPDKFRGPQYLLFNRYSVSFPRVRQPIHPFGHSAPFCS